MKANWYKNLRTILKMLVKTCTSYDVAILGIITMPDIETNELAS